MRAVVAGGGVAASASAIAAGRIGVDAPVYEAYEDPAGPVGSYVSLAVNGLRALDALGCLPAVQAAGFAVARQRMWSGRGQLLGAAARGRARRRRPDLGRAAARRAGRRADGGCGSDRRGRRHLVLDPTGAGPGGARADVRRALLRVRHLR